MRLNWRAKNHFQSPRVKSSKNLEFLKKFIRNAKTWRLWIEQINESNSAFVQQIRPFAQHPSALVITSDHLIALWRCLFSASFKKSSSPFLHVYETEAMTKAQQNGIFSPRGDDEGRFKAGARPTVCKWRAYRWPSSGQKLVTAQMENAALVSIWSNDNSYFNSSLICIFLIIQLIQPSIF